MTLVNVKPGRKVNYHKSIFDNLFDEFFKNEMSSTPVKRKRVGGPAVNIIETTDGFRIDLAVPGLRKKDIAIDLEKDVLTIGSNFESKASDTEKYIRQEFFPGTFKRTFRLPDTIDAKSIQATFKNGVLSVVLGKKEEAKEQAPRAIKIS